MGNVSNSKNCRNDLRTNKESPNDSNVEITSISHNCKSIAYRLQTPSVPVEEFESKTIMESRGRSNCIVNKKSFYTDLNAELFDNPDVGSTDCDSASNIRECKAVQRIQILLSFVQHSTLSNQDIVNIFHQEINDHYNASLILNDYIHIINTHNSHLENICDAFSFECDMEQCNIIRRNQRNRMVSNTSDAMSSLIDIFDQIHMYLLHSFDIGFALSKQEISLLSSEEQKEDNCNVNRAFIQIRKLLHPKRERFLNITQSFDRIKYTKFVTIVDDEQTENKEENQKITYDFSHRFHYWGDCNETDLYILQKYHDLKHELLNNNIFTIDSEIWQSVNNKARLFIDCRYVKSWKLDTSFFSASINRSLKQCSMSHLICIILYCDFTDLSYNFSSSFRYSDSIKTFKQLKLYHSNYHWFGKKLRELVEGYGSTLHNCNKHKFKFYHGISQKMLFHSTVSKFCHPTSTSNQMAVAQHFATHQGIIVELGHSNYNVQYFSCAFISSFGFENEFLFIGGQNTLNIDNIIECSTGIQYGEYLHALNCLSLILGSTEYENMGQEKYMFEKDEKILKLLIENETDTIPQYVCDIFNKFKIETKVMVIDLEQITEETHGSKYLASLFLISIDNTTKSFLNLSVIAQLFPNCEEIVLKGFAAPTKGCPHSSAISRLNRDAARYPPEHPFRRMEKRMGYDRVSNDLNCRPGIWINYKYLSLMLSQFYLVMVSNKQLNHIQKITIENIEIDIGTLFQSFQTLFAHQTHFNVQFESKYVNHKRYEQVLVINKGNKN